MENCHSVDALKEDITFLLIATAQNGQLTIWAGKVFYSVYTNPSSFTDTLILSLSEYTIFGFANK